MLNSTDKSKTNTLNSFVKYVDSYIGAFDKDNVVNIFPPLNAFKTKYLFNAFFDENNYINYEEAKDAIYRYIVELRYADSDYYLAGEINNYLYCLINQLFSSKDHLWVSKNRKGIYYLLKLSFFVAYKELINPREQKRLSSFDDITNDKRDNTYFRGQIDSEWRISPSIFRDLNKTVVFDDNYYYKLLKNAKLEEKYNELIRSKKGYEKYSKYAFMQHSLSFSPLIDFTKEKEIATSFALSNPSQINVLENKDSAVFDITVEKKHIINDSKNAFNFLSKEFKIYAIDENYFILGKEYILEDVDYNGESHEKSILITSIDKLLEQLKPKFKLFDIPVNDRMKYQKGVFLCFYDCIILNSHICYELNNDININKSIINTSDKRDILRGIYNHRKYDQEHLLNPYLYFTEYYFDK